MPHVVQRDASFGLITRRSKVAGSNPAPAIGRKPAYQAGFRVFGKPQKRRKKAMGQALGQGEVKVRLISGLARCVRSTTFGPDAPPGQPLTPPAALPVLARRQVATHRTGRQLRQAGVSPARPPRTNPASRGGPAGRTDHSVHGLRFLASAIPHVGLNDPPEHFLISFEA